MTRRMVVVGGGMAATRFAELVADHGAGVTVIGDEPAYNRALLSEVVAGRADAGALDLPTDQRVRRVRATAIRLERQRRIVADSNGVVHPYDHLVLATGAEPDVPDLVGLARDADQDVPHLLAGCHVLRRRSDAAAIVAATDSARRAVVLGGGALGVELARALAGRGLGTTLVHDGEGLLDRYLDPAGSRALTRAVRHLRTEVLLNTAAVAVDSKHDHFAGLRLADGRVIHGDLLLLACGTRPATTLARAAALPAARGILVDQTLTTADPHIHALGDCAELRSSGSCDSACRASSGPCDYGRVSGTVAPAWEQAALLARRLTGDEDLYRPGPEVLRLTTADLDVVALGDPAELRRGADDRRTQVVALTEPAAEPATGRHVKAAVTDGVVRAGYAIGAPDVAAELVLLADRGTPVDPYTLLAEPAVAAPAAGDSKVCRCNSVTTSAIASAFRAGATTVAGVAAETRATTGCGSCEGAVGSLLDRLGRGEDVTAQTTSRRPSVSASSKHLVVVGGGMVAHRLVEALRSRDEAGDWRVTVLAEEPRLPYDRVALTTYFSGRDPHELALGEPELWDDPGVTLRKGVTATAFDPDQRTVSTSRGETIRYDELVLATGSYPFVPPVKGSDLTGCFVYRTVDDVAALRTYVEGLRESRETVRGVVVGGGLLGLEAAGALRALGAETTVVEFAPRLMPLQVDDGGGAALHRLIEGLGVDVRTAAQVTKVKAAQGGAARAVAVAEGNDIPTDVVVFAAGVRPRDELARAAGLAIGERGGVVVDESCRTSADGTWAIGEVACIEGRVWGLVAPGYAMAEVVADRLLDGAATFPGADASTKLKLLGVDVASFGDAFGAAEGALDIVYADPVAGVYKRLVLSDDARTLLGGILVGDASAYAGLRPMVGRPLGADPASYLLPEGAAPVSADLPDDAPVCSCNNVSAGALRCAVRDDGCQTVKSLCGATKAGTSCGSCLPILKNLLNSELAAAGVEVSKALCEHFALSRAELFDVVRVTGLRTFSEMVTRHGSGRGCDICKPVVASILASLDPAGHVLEGERAALQDTNDHVMANLQKDGTYSVVPRVPGGEITPEKLIVIGEVARDFGLYTKLTGGQRVDLFGARIEQLPAIWRRLVDAGFESGHAYGKALRTVKSCVGSTWCRYGVQDSVGMAIALELRYRGLRSPHKLKLGVSGCARECAEARGKDVGVIATENGWNLYVGGNGGMTPKHAQLLASDLDDEQLVRTIDRFLMYYIRTGDRLQRTSVWLAEIEGGLDHVRDVVIGDTLGIAADLDAAMAEHIGSYVDEWRATLEDPDKLARFVSFVNAPDHPDDDLRYVVERDQPRPASASERADVLVAGPRLEVMSR